MRMPKTKGWLIAIMLILMMGIFAILIFNPLNIRLVNREVNVEGLKLLDKEEKWEAEISANYTGMGMFGGKGYFNEKEGIEIIFSGYPDVIDKQVLTDIVTTNPEHSVLNLRVGDDADEAEALLRKKGFRIERHNEYYGFERGRVLLYLHFDERKTITKIAVRLRSTNRHNVQF